MNVHATPARPQRLSVGAAMLRVVISLLLFFLVFIPFLIAPLLALGAAFLVYVVLRSRGSRPRQVPGPGVPATTSAAGFGAGTS